MLLNYHEMTMDQKKDDPAKRQQFMVICTVMFSVLAYALMTSGALVAIAPTVGVFPGGYFCYKFAQRDYAASMGVMRVIQSDLVALKTESTDAERKRVKLEKQVVEAMTYHLYLDNPAIMGGRRQRWMTGIMGGDAEKKSMDDLMEKNKSIKALTEDQLNEASAREIFEATPYEMADLPSVDALVLQYPFTNGFVSALILSYRVIPAMRKSAKEKGAEFPMVFSSCSAAQQMCTHYVPLVKNKDFLLGRIDTEEHQKLLGPEHFLDWKGFKEGGRRVFQFDWAVKLIDMLP